MAQRRPDGSGGKVLRLDRDDRAALAQVAGYVAGFVAILLALLLMALVAGIAIRIFLLAAGVA